MKNLKLRLKRLLRYLLGRKEGRSEVAQWLCIVEALIAKHAQPKVFDVEGRGWGQTDTLAWVVELAQEVEREIKTENWRSETPYDINMSVARNMGLILLVWYAHVQRAKCCDPARPLEERERAARMRSMFLAELQAVLTDDLIMGEVWGEKQRWTMPFLSGEQ